MKNPFKKSPLDAAIDAANKKVLKLLPTFKNNGDVVAHYQPYYETAKDYVKDVHEFIEMAMQKLYLKKNKINLRIKK